MAHSILKKILTVISRKRAYDGQVDLGNLRRCLNNWDLTALGLGSTLGVGVYVLIGSVACNVAGPSVVLSFLIAFLAALFAGLCYAEFGSRVPKAGSSFVYSYVALGELTSFIVGWNNILEATFGTASLAKGLSLFVDSMGSNAMTNWFISIAPMDIAYLSGYFDFFAFAIVLVLGVLLAFGVRESSYVNNTFAAINMVVILFIIVFGAFKADSNNWSIPESEVPTNFGHGGFFPYGIWGMLRGAAICFYGFVGFDAISSTGDEVKSPRKVIPLTILAVLVTALVAYTSVAIVTTMMQPYYLQETVASMATAFTYVGWDWARWVVSIGAIFGIAASMFGAMYPLSRLLYAMSSDGLMLHFFSCVTKSKSPVVATLVPTVVISILAGILELDQLVIILCIGTLLSYSIVAVSVIKLRYNSNELPTLTNGYWKQMIGCGDKVPTQTSSRVVMTTLVLFVLTCIAMALVAVNMASPMITTGILHGVALMLLIIMSLQPQEIEMITFKTPLVPIVPCLSIYVNVHLMILINVQSWLRILIWLAIGIPVYFLCLFFYKQKSVRKGDEDKYNKSNGNYTVQIIVLPATPPDTLPRNQDNTEDKDNTLTNKVIAVEDKEQTKEQMVAEEIIVQQATIEQNEEKEAKIIDLLDQVLQAEEDSYEEIVYVEEKEKLEVEKTVEELNESESTSIPHRKSFSDLSDAGSDVSLGVNILSKYDVIAQVHREDLSKVNEEEERKEHHAYEKTDFENPDFDKSETNSQTDESGYFDTLERTNKETAEDLQVKDEPFIPPPPPPPMDESYFATPIFKKSYTVPARPKNSKFDDEEAQPRISVNSNTSNDDGTMVFGSDKQANFMSKLNTIFLNKMYVSNEEIREPADDDTKRRSNSTGNVLENIEFSINIARPSIFLDLKKELLSKEASRNLRPVNVEDKETKEEEKEAEEVSLSKDDLKSKLENIFANGGANLMKTRLMKSNPPSLEETSASEISSSESLAKPSKAEKNDTLKRQKDKFGAVLNSLRLSLNTEDPV